MNNKPVLWRPPVGKIIQMDALAYLRQIQDGAVNCIVTSPPYYGLRDYGVDGQIGLEETPEAFIKRLVVVFREARRVLRDDGVLWLNMGDAYATSPNGRAAADVVDDDRTFRDKPLNTITASGLRNKNQMLMPHRLALALQADGWIVRQTVIWHKPNPMPESVRDRPTTAHEYVFLLSKSPRYWYDAEAIKVPAADSTAGRGPAHFGGAKGRGYTPTPDDPNYRNGSEQWGRLYTYDGGTVNRRSVWTVATHPFSAAHFATFPPSLIEPMVLAGCPARVCAVCGAPYTRQVEREFIPQSDVSLERGVKGAPGQKQGDGTEMDALTGWAGVPRGTVFTRTTGHAPGCSCGASSKPGIVMDPFMGAGTVALVAKRLGRRWMGCELNPAYIEIAEKRLSKPVQVDLFASAGVVV